MPCGNPECIGECPVCKPEDMALLPPHALPEKLLEASENHFFGTWEGEVAKLAAKRLEQLEAAARLGLEMAKANDLWNTAEEIEQALTGRQSK